MELTFNLIEDDSDHTVTVPFLIAKDFLDMPIVGLNMVLKKLLSILTEVSQLKFGSLVYVLTSSLSGVERGKMEALVQFITSEPGKELATVKSKNKSKTVIPRGQLVIVSCRTAVGPVTV